MTRDEQTAAIVEHRLSKKHNVVNPDRIRSFIRGDLAALTAAEINAEYHRINGNPQRKAGEAKDYDATLLDRAISDALAMLTRPYLDHAAIGLVLVEDYDEAIAGAALALALEKSDQPEPPPTGVKFAEYQATLGRADTEDEDW